MSSQSPEQHHHTQTPEADRPPNQHTASTEATENQPGSTPRDVETGTGVAEKPVELSRDIVFDALKNSRRRQVLRYLKGRDEVTTLSDLAEHVASIENETTPERLTSQQRKRVYVGLYQCHLPKLDDVGMIEFNQPRGHVELAPAASQLDTYLYNDGDDARPWHQHYVAITAVYGVAIAASVALGVVDIVTAATLFVAVALGVAGFAVVHAYDRTG